MSFICKNGAVHKHDTVAESKECWRATYRPAPTPAPAVYYGVVYTRDSDRLPRPPGMSTWKQLDYVDDLKGNTEHAIGLDKIKCSEYIQSCIARNKAQPAAAPEPPAPKPVDKRLDLLKGMIDLVPDGYYAVQMGDDETHLDFLRLKRPKSGTKTYGGSLKVQTQHGPALELAAVLWGGSGKWSVYKASVVDMLLKVVTDHHGCAERYGQKLGRCMRCNCELTDDRSRYYGIGPECEQKSGWEWAIATMDERKGGSFEYLRGHGLLNVS